MLILIVYINIFLIFTILVELKAINIIASVLSINIYIAGLKTCVVSTSINSTALGPLTACSKKNINCIAARVADLAI